MSNIFEKIGNLFEKVGKDVENSKKRKEVAINKYWKLTAIERIDYDNKRKSINENNHYGLFPLTLALIRLVIWIVLTTGLFYFISDRSELILEVGISVSSFFLFFLEIFILIDICMILFCSYEKSKAMKELNKRFKI
jgi:hypothetical protein